MSFWNRVTHALNPVTHVKTAWNVVKNPFDPLKQTRAIVNMFQGPRAAASAMGRGGALQYIPPGGYAPQGGAPGFPPGMPPGYGMPPSMPPMPGSGMPPMPSAPWSGAPQGGGMFAPTPSSFGGEPAFYGGGFDPSFYGAQDPFYGQDTGWDAAYADNPAW